MNSKKKSKKTSTAAKKKAPAKKSVIPAEEETSQYDPTTPLMPELEELVKKNPNRLIGCGG